MRHVLALLLLSLIPGCTCGEPEPAVDDPAAEGVDKGPPGAPAPDNSGVGCIDGAQSLALSPAASTVTLSAGTAPASVPFTATARLAGDVTRDVTRNVNWAVKRDDDTPPGSISALGVYSPEPGAGGVVTVTASDTCGHAASTQLTLKLQGTFQQPAPEVVARFGGSVVEGSANKAPTLVYPSPGTRFPRNIYKVLFQWKRGGNDSFRLTFTGPYSTTVVYADGAHPQCAGAASTAGCYEADEETWKAIAGSNAGAAVSLTVEGVTSGDASVYRAAPVELGFSRKDVRGAIFYWSTTAAGIRRASVSDSAPEPYLVAKPTPTTLADGSTVSCVACHTVSRSGKKLFGGTKTSKATGLFVYDVTVTSPPTPVITTQISTSDKGFGTFSPDDARVVATVGSFLEEFHAGTGARIARLPVARGTNPDWSPTGSELVFSNQAGDMPAGAGLDVIARNADGTWGATRPLAPANGLTNLFPSYSPDGAYVAYARGRGGHGDRTLQLHLVKADGSSAPVELVTANRVVNGVLTDGQFENNMPTWAPPGDLEWVAFNSMRPYGVVFPAGGMQQIWVAAIDRSKLGTGVDPSFPAFRFAFQNLNENNHRAFWTLDVRDPDVGETCRPAGSDCAPGGASACCAGTECLAASELTYSCQVPPPPGNTCLPGGSTCSQTSGPACCDGTVCDVDSSGGTSCRFVVN